MLESILKDMRPRMDKSIEAFRNELSGLRTGRASTELLHPVTVDAYGAKMPLNQVASINIADTRLLSVQVWDGGLVDSVEKAIRDSGLGLNPQTEGNVIRIALPELTEERRQELVKLARKYGENAKVSLRNVRRDVLDDVKKLEKDGEISEDDQRRAADQIQKVTDEFTANVDEILEEKEKDILSV